MTPTLHRIAAPPLMALALLAAHAPARADAPDTDAAARLLVRVLMFVEWPAARLAEGQALALCVLEDSAMSLSLSRMAGTSINGHALDVIRARDSAMLARCHAAYPAQHPWLAMPHPGVLRVSAQAGALDPGGMVNLQDDGGRMAFDIGLGAVRRAGLAVSAKALRLARHVKDD